MTPNFEQQAVQLLEQIENEKYHELKLLHIRQMLSKMYFDGITKGIDEMKEAMQETKLAN